MKKCCSFNHFSKIYNKYNIYKEEISANNFIEFYLKSTNKWLYSIETVQYIFFLNGIKLNFRKGSILVNQSDFYNDIIEGDEIVSINNNSNIPLILRERIFEKIELKIRRNSKTYYLTFNPKIKSNISENIYKHNLIKLNNFENIDYEMMIEVISSNEKIVIDLSRNTGGTLASLRNILSIFILNNRINLKFKYSKNSIKKVDIFKRNLKNKVRSINFIVSQYTSSIAEIFILELLKYYNVNIFGKNTRGKICLNDYIKFDGLIVSYPVFEYIIDKDVKKSKFINIKEGWFNGINAKYIGEKNEV